MSIPPHPDPPPPGREFRAGDVVLLHDTAGRQYRLTLAAGASCSTHAGALAHDVLIDQPEGTVVATDAGRRLLALRPTFAEQVSRRRRAQAVHPKDLAAVLVHADVSPGDLVVVAGSVALALAALRAVGPSGRVASYGVGEEAAAAARSAAEDVLGSAPPNLFLRVGDVYLEGVIAERSADRVLLDLPEPWRAMPGAAVALRPGGAVAALCVNAPQIQRFCDELRELGGFGLIETVEVLERGWTVRGRSLRPAHRMVGHTAFLTFARRLAGGEVFEAEREGF